MDNHKLLDFLDGKGGNKKTFENNKNFERWKIWHLKDLLVNWIQKSNQGSKIMARFLALGG